MRSNMFANLESKFWDASEQELIDTALSALSELLDAIPGRKMETLFNLALLGARLGVAGRSIPNGKERTVIDGVFSKLYNGSLETLYPIICSEISEEDYKLFTTFTKFGNNVAMPFLQFVLSVAYADGVFEDDVAERLDGIFGINLLMLFFDSDLEEVPKAPVRLTGLEAELVDALRADDSLCFLRDIQAHFSQKSQRVLKNALNSLCEKGVLSCIKTAVGDMYSLENDNINTNVVPKNRVSKVPEKPKEKQPLTATQRENERIKREILDYLKSSQFCTVSDMIIGVKVCNGLTTSKMVGLLRRLEEEGLVERIVNNNTQYYHIK